MSADQGDEEDLGRCDVYWTMSSSAAPPPSVAPPAIGARRRAGAETAAVAADRVFAASLALGLLALLAAAVAVTRVFGTWRVGSAAHVTTVLGQRVAYPAANAGAIVVLGLAALGGLMAVAVGWRFAVELLADRRFRAALRERPLRRVRGAWVFDGDEPRAFCVGLLRPRVYVSSAVIELLDDRSLTAVLAHERHHARRCDPLRLACGRALAAGLLFVPTLRRLVQRQLVLAEVNADAAAMRLDGVDRGTLARVMLSFAGAGAGAGPEAPAIDADRVDHLLGHAPSCGLPLLLCVATAAGLAALIALALLASAVAVGSATLAPPLLSDQPCVVMLSALPLLGVGAAVALLRSRREA